MIGALSITLTSGKGNSKIFAFKEGKKIYFSIEYIGRGKNGEANVKIATFAPMSFSQNSFSNEYGKVEFFKRSGQGRILVRITAPTDLTIIREGLISSSKGEGLICLSPSIKNTDLDIDEKKVISEFFVSLGQTFETKLGEMYFDFL